MFKTILVAVDGSAVSNFGLEEAISLATEQGATLCVLAETVGRPVADVILGQARKCHADLIVLGTHGRRGMSRLVMGSDAEGVVREATVPVLLVRTRRTGRKAATKRSARS